MSAPVSDFRIAIATSEAFRSVHVDDVYFVAVLELLGVQPTVCVWNDPDVDWTSFDAVLIRTVWDYFQHYAAFLAWLDQLDRLGVPTINDTALVRWNSEKRYLLDLEQQGVPIIPTHFARAGSLLEVLQSVPAHEVVIKPSVSGGAWHTARGTLGTSAFKETIAALPSHLHYLVQPFVPEVATHGEWSLLYFGGAYSHAVLKLPAAGDYRVQEDHGGTATPASPDASIVQAADKALAAVAALGYREQAYARVDGVVVDGYFRIMELELIEPLLHLGIRPDAAERFAKHVVERLKRLKDERDDVTAANADGRS
jgi:glutathione synthase/RimK-type ligase-like ATP-grasp enzyme